MQSKIFPETEEAGLEQVAVPPLEKWIEREAHSGNALLKIDVQGYELEVLKGCESLLDTLLAIYVECSFIELYDGQALAHEVIDWLHARGFYLDRIGLMTFDRRGVSVQLDLLFLRRQP